MGYHFLSDEVCDLSEKAAQTRKPVKDVDGVPTTVTLNADPMTSHADVPRIELVSALQDCNDYRPRNRGVVRMNVRGPVNH